MQDSNSMMLTAALDYARRGIRVFPLVTAGKTPLTDAGFKDATCDEVQIRQWWGRWPEANIGAPTGYQFDVLDCDGLSTEAADYLAGRLPTIGQATTARPGGRHIYTTRTGAGCGAALGEFQMDYRGWGGYVVVPPSRVVVDEAEKFYSGAYEWTQPLVIGADDE